MEIFFERHKNIRSSLISRAFFALLIVLSGMIMFSCSNVMNGVVSQKTGVSIIVTNFSELNMGTERSLAPSSLTISDIDSFTITGEDLNGKTINQAITINSDGTIGEREWIIAWVYNGSYWSNPYFKDKTLEEQFDFEDIDTNYTLKDRKSVV